MKTIYNLIIIFILLRFTFCSRSQNIGKLRLSTFRPCSTPFLKNGEVKLRQTGRFIHYKCNRSFKLYGDNYDSCRNGRWEKDIPVCIRPGCAYPEVTDKIIHIKLNNGAALRISCHSGFEVAGNPITLCNGKDWDRPLGVCRQTNIVSSKSCDFESSSICGWSNDVTHYIDWAWKNSANRNLGPKTDHTYKKSFQGFFLVVEGRGDNELLAARLLSPVYAKNVSIDSCLRIYYHMYGRISGSLRIYIKPIKIEISEIITNPSYKIFEQSKSSSTLWREALANIPKQNDEFQLIIEGELDLYQLSDIAIDDVSILSSNECQSDRAITTQKPLEDITEMSNVQTCQGRCGIFFTTQKNTEDLSFRMFQCDCFEGCYDLGTCCQDYEVVCVYNYGLIDETTINIDNNNKIYSSNNITKIIFTTLSPEFDNSDYNLIPMKNNSEDIDLIQTADSSIDNEIQKGNLNALPTNSINYTFILIPITLISLIGIFFGLIIYFRRRQQFSNEPTKHLKKNYNRNSKNTSEQFSEIRFLTSDDDNLDFALQQP